MKDYQTAFELLKSNNFISHMVQMKELQQKQKE